MMLMEAYRRSFLVADVQMRGVMESKGKVFVRWMLGAQRAGPRPDGAAVSRDVANDDGDGEGGKKTAGDAAGWPELDGWMDGWMNQSINRSHSLTHSEMDAAARCVCTAPRCAAPPMPAHAHRLEERTPAPQTRRIGNRRREAEQRVSPVLKLETKRRVCLLSR